MTEPASQSTAAPRTEVRGITSSDSSRRYHVWFSPKRRTHALQGDIQSCVWSRGLQSAGQQSSHEKDSDD